MSAERIMASRFPGTCRICNAQFGEGTKIGWMKGEKPRHESCPTGDAVKKEEPVAVVETQATERIMSSKFPGTCRICNNRFGAGAKIGWIKGKGSRHLTCFTEESRKQEQASRADKPSENFHVPAPDGLDYYPFQKAGIEFLHNLLEGKNRAGVNADEMGAGKTIQALGIINLTPEIRRVLVVVPASLRLNWQREADKWLVRKMNVQVLTKTTDLIDPDAEFVILGIESLGRKSVSDHYLNQIQDGSFDLLIVDECHRCKNPGKGRTNAVLGFWDKKTKQAVKGLHQKCVRRLYMSGTPIVNRPIEFQTVLGAISWEFRRRHDYALRYCAASQKWFGKKSFWDYNGASHLDELQAILRTGYMLRRKKSDVLKELPKKVRQLIPVELPAGKGIEVLDEKQERRLQHIKSLSDQASFAVESGDETKYLELIRELDSEVNILFTDMSAVRQKNGIAKVPAIVEMVLDTLEQEEKVVVMIWHQEVANKIVAALEKKKIKTIKIIGDGTKFDKRDKGVQDFQEGDVRVAVCNMQAAGVGLTLTASNTVIFGEQDYVPGNLSQAEDRCHRIGTTKTVVVKHIVVDGSLDARMMQMVLDKQAILDAATDDVLNDREKGEDTPEKKKRVWPKCTDAERRAATEGLQRLANVCDGARRLDMQGFNGGDSYLGKRLAEWSLERPLTDGQVARAKFMLPKYHRQIGKKLIEELNPKTKEEGR